MEILFDDIEMVFGFIFSHLYLLNIVLAIIVVFFQRKDPTSVWAWLMLLYFIPVLGFIFYLFLGTDMHKRKMFRTKEIEDRLNEAIRKQEYSIKHKEMEHANPAMEEYSDLVLFNLEVSNAIMSRDNEVTFYTDGKEKFAALVEDIKNAKKFVHIQYYIFRDDEAFAPIVEAVLQKAAEGVEVRILYDGMGARFIKKSFWKNLSRKGVQVTEFFPAKLRRMHLRMNYRNHRKIVVIDGKIGYVGGFNVGREYLGMDKKFGYWRDTHMRIRGSAVQGLQARFILDWNYANDNREQAIPMNEVYLPENTEQFAESCEMQIVSSGPDSRFQNVRDTYLRLIAKARKSIYIQTPYFIPDEAMISALTIAVHSGIEVNIMIPCKPDHPFVYWATYSYVGDLVMAGAKCYTYNNGFLHAKGIIVDEMVLCYGTANMDIRSFALNFEVNAVIYDEKKAKEMTAIFKKDLELCRQITKNVYLSRSLVVRLKEQVSRLLSPIL